MKKKTTKTDTKKVAPARSAQSRRGNVLVLVAGILVLLLITGFSYLSRTRAERRIASAQQAAEYTDDVSGSIKSLLATEIAEQLFPRPIDPNGPPVDPANGVTEDPNYPRMPISLAAPRYGVDVDYEGIGRPSLWWNHAPYHTIPWTNMPDFFLDPLSGIARRHDDIPGNPGTGDFRILADFEPARWFVDPTPPINNLGNQGQDEMGPDGVLTTPDVPEYFSHWPHMSNPMRPGTGWMIVPLIRDLNSGDYVAIDNIELAVSQYQIQSAIDPNDPGIWGTPFEQWLPHTVSGVGGHGAFLPADMIDPNTGLPMPKNYIQSAVTFSERWHNWFTNYERTWQNLDGLGIPGNYYKLSDCYDGGGGLFARLEFGERPEDASLGPGRDATGTFPNGAPRWHIERILADADGDGFTDSFWYLAPVSMADDLRTLVAMRVVDLSGAVNVNTATQAVRGRPEPGNGLLNHGTRGWSPADVALTEVIQPNVDGLDMPYSSFLTNREHTEGMIAYLAADFPGGTARRFDNFYPDGGVLFNNLRSPWGTSATAFDPGQWQGNEGSAPFDPTITFELGLDNDFLKNPINRLDYWRRSGLNPFEPKSPDPGSTFFSGIEYSPFTLANMTELWGYNASNSPWNLTQLERAFQQISNSTLVESILRAHEAREETQPYWDELDVRPTNGFPFDEYLHDLRHRMTVISGARNETMPAWMWWENRWESGAGISNFNTPAFTGPNGVANFLRQSRLKLDLREISNAPFSVPDGVFTSRQLLPWRILTALVENPRRYDMTQPTLRPRFYYDDVSAGGDKLEVDDLDPINTTYVGTLFDAQIQREFEQTARLAAGLAANMATYSDNDFEEFPVGSGNVFYLPYFDLARDAALIPVEPGNVTVDGATTQTSVPGRVHPTRRMLGMEVQPFIAEAFIAHVFSQTVVAINDHPANAEGVAFVPGEVAVLSSDSNERETILAIQIGNPFDKPIQLIDQVTGGTAFVLHAFGQDYPLYDPARPNPRTVILPHQAITYYAISGNDQSYRLALDLQVPGDLDPDSPNDVYDQTRFDVEYVNATSQHWSTDPYDYGGGTSERAIEIRRVVFNDDPATGGTVEAVPLVIDRIDIHGDGMLDDDFEFGERVTEDLDFAIPGQGANLPEPPPGVVWPDVRKLTNGDRWIEWVRVAREWDLDANANLVLDDSERNPRYVFATREVSDSDLNDYDDGFDTNEPEDNWFNDPGATDPTDDFDAKVTRFHPIVNDVTTEFPLHPDAFFDKQISPQYTGQNGAINPLFAMQMLQKDADFEQVGEIRNVWMYGHMLKFLDLYTSPTPWMLDTTASNGGTIRTFAEFMIDGALTGMDRGVNRLRIMPEEIDYQSDEFVHSQVLGLPLRHPVSGIDRLDDPRALQPELPAGARLMDAFVCDGPGYNARRMDMNGNGTFGDAEDLELLSFQNAGQYAGKLTAGLININTAPREVLRALPHMSRLVHETDIDDDDPNNPFIWAHLPVLDPNNPSNLNPAREYNAGRIRVPEAIEAYRERYGIVDSASPTQPLLTTWPDYRPAYGARGVRQDRWPVPPANIWDPQLNQSRGERGFASIGEVAMLNRNARFGFNPLPTAEQARQWQRGFSIEAPANESLAHLAYWASPQTTVPPDVDVSIDLIDAFDTNGNIIPDETRGDAEEMNMLFGGISNLISTRSDIFGVWFKVRTVRQDSATGVWDGTRSDLIVDESRYFMIIDRSRVNSAADQPRILLFEKMAK